MKVHRFHALFGILFLVFVLPACAGEKVASRSVIDALLNWDLALAEQGVANWQKMEPKNHALPLHRALILVAEADYAKDDDSIKYDKPLVALAGVIELNESFLQLHPGHFSSRMSLATAKAISGRLYMEQNRWLQAYRFGKSSRAIMYDLVRERPDFDDGYLVLGLFEYFTGSAPLLLRWLGFIVDFSGDKNKGIEYLERCVEKGQVASPQAADALLLEIDFLSGEACRYTSLARLMIKRYPNNPRYPRAMRRLDRQCQSAVPDSRHKPAVFALAEPQSD